MREKGTASSEQITERVYKSLGKISENNKRKKKEEKNRKRKKLRKVENTDGKT